MNRPSVARLLPAMLAFFVMGFVDLVGIASNYVKADLLLSDAEANVFPSLVFVWFLLFSVPTGMLMDRIGRKRTVLLSLAITAVSLALPILGDSYGMMLVAFSLLGIGNALLQTSLNPLVAAIVKGQNLAGTLTFGQFVKAIASFLAPYIAMWGATATIPELGLGWRVLFPIYMIIALIALLYMGRTPVEEEPSRERASGFVDCLSLLGRPIILLSFIGIMCHVGIDVGTNTTAPKILVERIGLPLNEAANATGIYFIFRTIGALSGSYLLRRMSERLFYALSVILLALGLSGMGLGESATILYPAIALVGLGNSNVFSLIYSRALLSLPGRENAISGLMIMGLFGGSIFPLLMGFASDAVGQIGAVLVMGVGALYLLSYITRVKR